MFTLPFDVYSNFNFNMHIQMIHILNIMHKEHCDLVLPLNRIDLVMKIQYNVRHKVTENIINVVHIILCKKAPYFIYII